MWEKQLGLKEDYPAASPENLRSSIEEASFSLLSCRPIVFRELGTEQLEGV
jgi:hypothetical protein